MQFPIDETMAIWGGSSEGVCHGVPLRRDLVCTNPVKATEAEARSEKWPSFCHDYLILSTHTPLCLLIS